MPPAKSRLVHEDSRSEGSTVRERQIAAAAHARKSKNGVSGSVQQQQQQRNGGGGGGVGTSSLKDLALASTQSAGDAGAAAPGQGAGMQWNTVPRELLNTYRVAHHLSTPAAFTSPLNQALLCNPGIGRQSPTMARKREKRRISKEQLALAVRKNFNGAAVSEIDVVVELVYKVRHQDKAFRMRSTPSIGKKQ